MKTKRAKRKNKYRELRAAIAAIRRNNGALLAVLPQWPELWRMVYSAREIQWRLRRHFPGNAFFARVFHEELAFFKAVLPTAREERTRAYWELLRRVAGFSRRVLARFSENTVRSLEGEKFQAVCLAEIGDGVLKKIRAAMGGEARRPRQSGRTGGTDKQACRHWTGGEGRRGRQAEYMEKQRKVFLDYLKIHHETASKTRMTLARDCWAIHRREWVVPRTVMTQLVIANEGLK